MDNLLRWRLELLPPGQPQRFPIQISLTTTRRALPAWPPGWPDKEHRLVELPFDEVREPWRCPVWRPVLLAEVRGTDEVVRLGELALRRWSSVVLLAPAGLPDEVVRMLSRSPRLVRVVARGPESEQAFLARAARATEAQVRFQVYRALRSFWHEEALRLRDEIACLDALPPEVAHEERAPLATTLWAHVHGVAGLVLPGLGKTHLQLGTSSETERRVRRRVPAALASALAVEAQGRRSGGAGRDLALLPAALARAQALALRLDDELRAQALTILGRAELDLSQVEARAIKAALRRCSGNVSRAAQRLGIGPDRVRAHLAWA